MINKQKSLEQLEPSVIKVESIDNENPNAVFGTAFLIEKTRNSTFWLTCAHVIKDIGGIEKVRVKEENRNIYKPVELAGLDSDSIFNLQDNHDLAVFRVDGLYSMQKLDLIKDTCRDLDFISLGNFRGPNNTLSMRPVSGTLYADFIAESDTSSAWMYKLEMDERSPLEKGYSGSPIYVPELQKVVGVINRKNKGDSRQGYGVSVEAAANIFDRVPELNKLRNQILMTGVQASNWFLNLLDKPLRLALGKQTRIALEWFSQKGIVNLAKQASDYAVENSEPLKLELQALTSEQEKLELLGDFQWEFEKYLERIYGSLLTDSKELLIDNDIGPSLSADVYETAFEYIKNIFPEYLDVSIVRKIELYMNCLVENLYSN